MQRTTKVTCRLLTVGVLAGGVIAPQIASGQDARAAKVHKVSVKATIPVKGTKITGTFSGSPFGKGKVTGKLLIPVATVTLHAKGGTATLRYTGTVTGTKVSGPFKWIKGTGKFKGIKGKGTSTGDLAGNYRFKGTASY